MQVWSELYPPPLVGLITPSPLPAALGLTAAQQHQVWHHVFGDVEVNQPIHEIETDEANGEEYPTVLVDI